MGERVLTHVHTTHAHTHGHIWMLAHTHMHTSTHVYIHARIHTHTHNTQDGYLAAAMAAFEKAQNGTLDVRAVVDAALEPARVSVKGEMCVCVCNCVCKWLC